MARLFDIDERLRNALEYGVDSETGELFEDEELEKLINGIGLERDIKIDNICNFIKELDAEAEAIKKEADKLTARKKAKENKRDSLKRFLDNYMKYCELTKFETAKNVVSYRKSTKLNVNESVFLKVNKKLCSRIITYKYDKSELTRQLKQGKEIKGCELQENMNLQVK